MMSSPLVSRISEDLQQSVLCRLGLETEITLDASGLARFYQEWCRNVPFDNLRKLIALRSGLELPGRNASDFFAAWLAHRSGGTCWAGTNALCELLLAIGFNAHRVAASMYDMGMQNHGTVIVTLDGADWLLDSSLLTETLIPVSSQVFQSSREIINAEIEPDSPGHLLWAAIPNQPTPIVCRIIPGPITHDYLLERYEASRERSPFNQVLYARRNLSGRVILIRGCKLYERTASGITESELSEPQLRATLIEDFGYSKEIVDQLANCGALADSMQPFQGPPPPPVKGVPPSQRI